LKLTVITDMTNIGLLSGDVPEQPHEKATGHPRKVSRSLSPQPNHQLGTYIMTDRAAYSLIGTLLAITFLALPVTITIKAAQLTQHFQAVQTTITTK
jgi:hypothetical protein